MPVLVGLGLQQCRVKTTFWEVIYYSISVLGYKCFEISKNLLFSKLVDRDLIIVRGHICIKNKALRRAFDC